MTARHAAPILLGALAGALVAARLDTALACAAAAALVDVGLGAPRPARRWWGVLGTGAALAFVLNVMVTRGAPLLPPAFGWLARHASVEGARLGALFVARIAGAALAVHGLATAWPGERAADVAARALAPLERLGVPVRDGRTVLGLAVRFAPSLARDAERIARVQDLRAGRPPSGWRERLTRRRAALVPALVSTLERAEHVAMALEARHYRLRSPQPEGGRGAPAWGSVAAGVALAAGALLFRVT